MSRHTDDQQKVMQNDPEKVNALLLRMRNFLKGQSVSLDGGWAIVTEADMKEFNELVQGMVELRFGEDADRDRPVNFRLVDRTRFEPMHYWPLRYEHEAETMDDLLEIMHLAEMNLGIATSRFQSLWKILEYRRKEKKGKPLLISTDVTTDERFKEEGHTLLGAGDIPKGQGSTKTREVHVWEAKE